jgi:hypothetical protein
LKSYLTSPSFWAFVAVPLWAICGAWISVKVKHGANIFWIPIFGIFSSSSWIVIARHSELPLAISSVLYDFLFDGPYTLFLFLKDGKMQQHQCAGIVLALLGLLLMGYKK